MVDLLSRAGFIGWFRHYFSSAECHWDHSGVLHRFLEHFAWSDLSEPFPRSHLIRSHLAITPLTPGLIFTPPSEQLYQPPSDSGELQLSLLFDLLFLNSSPLQ